MNYIENPKTKGSGVIACIPQKGVCPNKCEDCFFQSGRSYLEPLSENLPNIPDEFMARNRIVRMNDGNDSNVNRELVERIADRFQFSFFNTAIPKDLDKFGRPVVLTINPGKMTDSTYYKLDSIPKNLMFVRIRTNTWNLDLVDNAADYYSLREVPVVLTFMAYFTTPIPDAHKSNYIYRKRTINDYWAITTDAWREVMKRYEDNIWVYSCGKIEGEKGSTACARCGNCIREFFVTLERMRK